DPVPTADGDLEPAMHRIETNEHVDNLGSVQSVLRFESALRRNGDELNAMDHGRYQCVFENELLDGVKEYDRAESYLRIEHSPVLKHLHNRVAYDINQTAVLRCEMSAYPRPTFEWIFENRPLEPQGGPFAKYSMHMNEQAVDVLTATLFVHNVQLDDYGEDTCRACNNVGEHNDKRTIINLLERSG